VIEMGRIADSIDDRMEGWKTQAIDEATRMITAQTGGVKKNVRPAVFISSPEPIVERSLL
jgi:hypothetical protein